MAKASLSPKTVVFGQAARRSVLSGAMWGYIYGAVVASSAVSYLDIYKTKAERDHLAATFGANHASSALFGPAPQLQTVGGFTLFKSFMTITIIGAIWGVLTSTRLLRGEEDNGRLELLLAGQTTQRAATVQILAGLGTGVTTLWAITTIFIVAVGQYSTVDIGVRPGLFLAVTLSASALMFLAVGAFTSQIAATRRRAAGYGAWALGVSYAIRMVADSGTGVHWIIWASPLGWIEQLQPLSSPDPMALTPIFGFTLVLAVLSVRLAGNRDLGASIIPDKAEAPPHLGLLTGQFGLTTRLLRSTVAAWGCAITITGIIFGLIAKAAGTAMTGSSVQAVFKRLGAPGFGAKAYLGVAFLMLAVLAGFIAAGQVTAARTEEAEGRLDNLLVRPVSRWAWIGGRVGVAIVFVVAGSVVGGFATWLGTTAENSGVGVATLLDAGLNVVAPALCVLGLGVLAFGWWPRTTSYLVYGVLGWSLLIDIVGGIGAINHFVLDTSVFHQMSAAPAVSPNWEAAGLMAGIGAVAAFLGGVGFRFRDITGE